MARYLVKFFMTSSHFPVNYKMLINKIDNCETMIYKQNKVQIHSMYSCINNIHLC